MDNLLATLRDALEIALDYYAPTCHTQAPKVDAALQLLSTPDALAWALLEEMAGDVEAVGAWVLSNYFLAVTCLSSCVVGLLAGFALGGRVYRR